MHESLEILVAADALTANTEGNCGVDDEPREACQQSEQPSMPKRDRITHKHLEQRGDRRFPRTQPNREETTGSHEVSTRDGPTDGSAESARLNIVKRSTMHWSSAVRRFKRTYNHGTVHVSITIWFIVFASARLSYF